MPGEDASENGDIKLTKEGVLIYKDGDWVPSAPVPDTGDETVLYILRRDTNPDGETR